MKRRFLSGDTILDKTETSTSGKMRFKSLRTLELLLLVLVLWAVCSLVLWKYRGSCPAVEPSKPCRYDVARPRPLLPVPDYKDPSKTLNKPIPLKSPVDVFHGNINITPIYVVEEHHEVLRYWYHAVDKGMIPKTGNIILHIDGHSDGAVPFQWQHVPLFRPPKDKEDIHKMMQQNDIFIVAAAMTGLINRYIWVWPPWDTSDNEHPGQVDYIKMNVRAGTTFRTVRGKRQLELCACSSTGTAKIKTVCYMNNVSTETDTDSDEEEGILMDEKDCLIKSVGIIEIVSERQAIVLMKSGRWIQPSDNVILDIDEDYYGCEAAVLPLYNAWILESEVRDISMWMQLLVCATGTYDERVTDNWFHSMIQVVKDHKRFCASSEMKEVFCDNTATRTSLWKFIPELLYVLRQRLRGRFCRNNPEFILKMLLSHLASMSVKKLTALAEVGVCLSMSPKTTEFNGVDNIRVCDGYNRPNDTMVVFHTPDIEEIEARTDALKMILDPTKITPRVVTICRSTRDGYTPKRFFRKIEFNVLRTLLDAFPAMSENNIYYDADLLGGQSGWHGRH